MASSPIFKIFNPQGEYIGCLKHLEDCAAVVSTYGAGASVRVGHSKRDTIYTDGQDGVKCEDSYDAAAEAMREGYERLKGIHVAALAKARGEA